MRYLIRKAAQKAKHLADFLGRMLRAYRLSAASFVLGFAAKPPICALYPSGQLAYLQVSLPLFFREQWAGPLVDYAEGNKALSELMRSFSMGEFTDKAKGVANEAIGNAKQAIGKATDNKKLEAEGIVQEGKGEAQKVGGAVKGALGDKV